MVVRKMAAVVIVASVVGVGALAQGEKQYILAYGRETPGKCGKLPAEPATATCSAPAGPKWICREIWMGYGEDARPSGNGWVAECVRPKAKTK